MKLLDNILDFILGARYKEYAPALRILTKNENFYHAIKYYFKDCYILPKVCLRSIFKVNIKNMSIKDAYSKDAYSKAANSKSDTFSLNAKINHKHVDFTIINKNLEIEYCFELDDNSHYYPSSQTRDMLVGEIFDDGGIKLVRVLFARRYDEYTISEASIRAEESSYKSLFAFWRIRNITEQNLTKIYLYDIMVIRRVVKKCFMSGFAFLNRFIIIRDNNFGGVAYEKNNCANCYVCSCFFAYRLLSANYGKI